MPLFSCDTFVALGNVTSDQRVIIAKNSDREPNEPNNMKFIPAASHELPQKLQCTYISIPQIESTPDLLLMQPSWMWGAEYGSNSYGVCIGNEGVFSGGSIKEPALLGMDLLRLGLERGKTAFSALQVIINLLEEFGQGGNCGLHTSTYYNNAFIIADRREAYVLETYERFWVWKQVTDVYAISNCYSITDDWDDASDSLKKYAVSKGYCTKDNLSFNFSSLFSEKLITTIGRGKKRRCQILDKLKAKSSNIEVEDCMSILRLHNEGDFNPSSLSSYGKPSICMHYSGYIRRAQTTGSCISHLALPNEKNQEAIENSILDTHWITGTSIPCISIFKPIVGIDSFPSELFGETSHFYNSQSFWWKGEILHRLVIQDFENRAPLLRARGKFIETEALSDSRRFTDRPMKGNDIDGIRKEIATKYTQIAINEMKELTELFISKEKSKNLSSWKLGSILSLWYFWNWKKLNSKSFVLPLKFLYPRILPIEIIGLFAFGSYFLLRRKFKR